MKDEKYDTLLDEDKFDVVRYIRQLWLGLMCIINGVVVGCFCFIIGYDKIILGMAAISIFLGLTIFLPNLLTKYPDMSPFFGKTVVIIINGCALLVLAMFKINITVAVIIFTLFLFEIIVYVTVPWQTKTICWVKKKLKRRNRKD